MMPLPPATPPSQEVTGSAIAILLLSKGAIPLWGGVLLSAAASFLLLLIERHGMRSLEALFGGFIAVMVAAFAVRTFLYARILRRQRLFFAEGCAWR